MDGWAPDLSRPFAGGVYKHKIRRAPDLGNAPIDTFTSFVNLEYAMAARKQAAESGVSYLSGVQFPPLPGFVLPGFR